MALADTVLAICEFGREVEPLRLWGQGRGPRGTVDVLALQPEVWGAADEAGLSCRDTVELLGNEGHRRILEGCQPLLEAAEQALWRADDRPPAAYLRDSFLYHFRFILNNLAWMVEVLDGVERDPDLRDRLLVGARTPWSRGRRPRPHLSAGEGLVAPVLQAWGEVRHRAVHLVDLPGSEPGRADAPWTTAPWRLLGALGWRRRLRSASRRPQMLLSSTSYNLDRFWREWREKQPELGGWVTGQPLEGGKAWLRSALGAWRPLPRAEGIRSLPLDLLRPLTGEGHWQRALQQRWEVFVREHLRHWTYRGVSLEAPLRAKVEQDLLPHLAELHQVGRAMGRALRWLKPRLVVSAVSVDHHQVWGEMARACGVPGLVIPQKTLVRPQDPVAALEQKAIGRAQVAPSFAHVAAQNPQVLEYLDWASYPGTIWKTGNLTFSRVRPPSEREGLRQKLLPELRDGVPLVLVAPSMKSRKSRRFWVLETLDELVVSLRELVEVARDLPDLDFVFRLHPGQPVTPADVARKVHFPANLHLSAKGTYEEVLSLASVVISHSSSAALEAVLNAVPLVLYDPWKRYCHLPAHHQADAHPTAVHPVYHVQDRGVLQAVLQWILSRQEAHARPALFEAYRLPPGERCPFDRWMEGLLEIGEHHEQN